MGTLILSLTHAHVSGIPELLVEKKVGDVMVDVHVVVKNNWQHLLNRNFVPYVASHEVEIRDADPIRSSVHWQSDFLTVPPFVRCDQGLHSGDVPLRTESHEDQGTFNQYEVGAIHRVTVARGMQHEVDKFKGAHEEISLRLFKQGKPTKGKKILVHPLRVLGTFSRQSGRDCASHLYYSQRVRQADLGKR